MKTLIVIYYVILTIHLLFAEDGTIWNERATAELKDAIGLKLNMNKAKNVILFLGDGMSIATVSAARLYKAQLTGQVEGTSTLTFEKFPHVALSKTYTVDRQTADSAGTATAYLCGIKTTDGTVGVNSNVHRANCSQQHGNEVTSILDWSKAEGKSTGIVTTARITHATPAASYAHSADRNWESDSNVDVDDRAVCHDIARQLIEDNLDIDVVLGGGKVKFLPPPGGDRNDSRDLVQEWKDNQLKKGRRGIYVETLDELNSVDEIKTGYLLGLFAQSHMDYAVDRNLSGNANNQPSIADMTHSAIQLLKRNHKGYFLLVEGGRIDHAHHENLARKALYDTIAFDEAVEKALEDTDADDTLIIVTADHSHVFSMAADPKTGNDILGFVSNPPKYYAPKDGLPYTSLIYGNGPGGYLENKTDGSGQQRRNLTNINTKSAEFKFDAAVWMSYETHAADDVGIFATGPMSHLFHGVHEQNYIAHVMSYASCVGPHRDDCAPGQSSQQPSNTDCINSSPHTSTKSMILFFTFLLISQYCTLAF